MSGKDYARLVSMKYRSARSTPRINRPIRPRVIAWAGPKAFYPNRFYEIDRWYKARIDKPEKIPKLHIIDPSEFTRSIYEITANDQEGEIDIGFALNNQPKFSTKTDEQRVDLERKARRLELRIELDQVRSEDMSIYYHCKIFEHLFGKGTYFHNVQQLNVVFGDIELYNGNIISATSLLNRPQIEIESIGNGGYSTLLLVNIDGNPFEEKPGEIVQWLIKDIPDGKGVDAGTEVLPYLQPIPFMGTGYHRMTALLFRHPKPIDFNFKLDKTLIGRVMKVSQFYKASEEQITPSAVRFCQTSYDLSCKKALHDLGMKSPIYSYEFNDALKPTQREFPVKPMPFNLYLDMYRDPKEIEEELLEERLKRAQITDYRAPKWLDPNYNDNKRDLAPWIHDRIIARKGRYTALYENVIKD